MCTGLRRYIISAALLLLLLCQGSAFAQSRDDLQQEKARIEAQIRQLNQQLSTAKKNTRLSKNQLYALSKKIKERNRLITNINQQMGLLNKQIVQTQDSVNIMHSHVDSLKNEYAKVIRVLYRERDNRNITTFLFDTPGYNKAFLRHKYYREYSRYRKHQAAFIHQREQELSNLSAQLQAQKKEKSSLLTQEQQQKAQLAKEQQVQQRNLSTARANEKQLNTQLTKKQKEKRALDKQIQRLIAEEVAKANKARNTDRTMTASNRSSSSSTKTNKSNTTSTTNTTANVDVALSNTFTANKGKLAWPVSYKSVIREFGRYQHSSGGENMSNGIELATSPNATVYSIFNGTVTRVFICPNGTKGIIVRHGDYMSVYANLSGVNVREGTSVKTRQAIGSVYADEGTSTGDFSFQIWSGRTPVNPRTWLR
jgi:septal ring factor EnvC (AmiA/AmiB activator)